MVGKGAKDYGAPNEKYEDDGHGDLDVEVGGKTSLERDYSLL